MGLSLDHRPSSRLKGVPDAGALSIPESAKQSVNKASCFWFVLQEALPATSGGAIINHCFEKVTSMYAIAFEFDDAALGLRTEAIASAKEQVCNVLEEFGFEYLAGNLYLGKDQVTSITCVLAVQTIAARIPSLRKSFRQLKMLRIDEQCDLIDALANSPFDATASVDAHSTESLIKTRFVSRLAPIKTALGLTDEQLAGLIGKKRATAQAYVSGRIPEKIDSETFKKLEDVDSNSKCNFP